MTDKYRVTKSLQTANLFYEKLSHAENTLEI